MTLEAFKDFFFDLLNDSPQLPISDICAHDKENLFEIILDDHSEFLLHIFDKSILK